MKNQRAKTVDRANAYECRLIDGQPGFAVKYYQAQDSMNPYARVKVQWGDDLVGHDMYVQVFQQYDLIDNPLAPSPIVVDADPDPEHIVFPSIRERGGGLIQTKLTKYTLFPSTRELLNAGISCREQGGKGWAVYWMEGGVELTLFPGGEGPQEMSSVDELIDALGGDQECVLTPASIKRFGTLEALQAFLREQKTTYTQLEFSDFIHIDCCHEPRTTYEQMIDEAIRNQ